MLIATITALILLLFGGGAAVASLFSDISEKEVKSAVVDEADRARILELSEALGTDLEANETRRREQTDSFQELQTTYGASPADYDRLAVELESTLAERHEMVLETRSAMKEVLTEEEWNALFAER